MSSTEVMEKPATELVAIETLTAETVFAPGGVDAIIAAITAKVRAFKGDVSTKAGREEISSFAYKISRSKTALDNLGKDLVSDWKSKAATVDAGRRTVRDRLDALRDEVRKPLDDFEDAEKARVAGHEAALTEISAAAQFAQAEPSAADIRARLEAPAPARDWQEFSQRAAEANGLARWTLTEMLAAAVKREADRAELDRLRTEAAAREQKDREDRIAAEAATRAREDAEAKAKAAADAAAADLARVETERAAATARAEQAERDRVAAEQKAEADRIAAAERTEQDRLAAEAKAEQDRVAAEARAAEATRLAAEQAERDRLAAVEAERKRVADAQAAEDAAKAAREADIKHRAEINGAATAALASFGLDDLTARRVVDAIADGFIPAVSISY